MTIEHIIISIMEFKIQVKLQIYFSPTLVDLFYLTVQPLAHLIILYHNPHKNVEIIPTGAKIMYIINRKRVYNIHFTYLRLFDIAGGTTKLFLLHVDIHKYLHELLEYLYAGR